MSNLRPAMNFTFGNITAFDYQQEAFKKCVNHMSKSTEPAIVYASVSAGKSLMMAMIAYRLQQVSNEKFTHKVMVLARQGELVKQNSDEAWGISVMNSIYSASIVKPKSINNLYPVIFGTEGTVYNELHKAFADYSPSVLLIDEAHMVNYNDPDSQYMKIIREFQDRNPELRIIGMTGSPWRGRDSIIGEFWKKQLCSIDREYLTNRGFVMPTIFGFGATHYNFGSTFTPDYQSTSDLTRSQLSEMESQILKDKTATQEIMEEVKTIMEGRNLALITCSGHKHCREAAKYLPVGSYAIITEKTTPKERLAIKDRCNRGELKYVLQIGCWVVGVSINRLDTLVILRRIGSLTLYEQLIGRGVRKLRAPEVEAGVIKNECLVLDYTDTSEVMAALFNSDELDKAEQSRAKQNDEDLIECPDCATMNSMKARRCCGDNNGSRCEFFWNYKDCEHCHTRNDTTARTCRKCGEWMIDPNEKLLRQSYTDADYKEVLGFSVRLSNDQQKVIVNYILENHERASELFTFNRKVWEKAKWRKFCNEHIQDKKLSNSANKSFSAVLAAKYFNSFEKPDFITHRLNDKGYSVINRKVMPWQKSPLKEAM